MTSTIRSTVTRIPGFHPSYRGPIFCRSAGRISTSWSRRSIPFSAAPSVAIATGTLKTLAIWKRSFPRWAMRQPVSRWRTDTPITAPAFFSASCAARTIEAVAGSGTRTGAAAATPAPAPDPATASIVRAAQEAEKNAGAVIGVSVLHLETGWRIAHRGNERFQMASVFKVPVAIATLGAAEKGMLRLDQDVEIRPAERQKIGPLYDGWKPGMRVTVERMVDVMLVYSDNTAADKLIQLLGGPSAVEKALTARGVTGIRISLDEKSIWAIASG